MNISRGRYVYGEDFVMYLMTMALRMYHERELGILTSSSP